MKSIRSKKSSNKYPTKINDDRNKEISQINEALKLPKTKIIVLSGGKGVGKTFTAEKYAKSNKFDFKEINLFDLSNAIKQNEKVYKNIGFRDGIKYFLFSSKNILLTKTFWFGIIFSIPSLIFGIFNLLNSLNVSIIYISFFFLVVGSIVLLYIIILLMSWFHWHHCNNIDNNLNIENTKNRVILFTDNNMNQNEPLDLIFYLLKFYSKCKNQILIYETSRDDNDLKAFINKLNGHFINIKSNEQLNNEICIKYMQDDLMKLNIFWTNENTGKFQLSQNLNNRIYCLSDQDTLDVKYSITFFDYELKKWIAVICKFISNREMLEIENKYNNHNESKDLNFVDFLIIQITKTNDSVLLNLFMEKKVDFYYIENNKYIGWSAKHDNIYTTFNNMVFKNEEEQLSNLMIERMYPWHKRNNLYPNTLLTRGEELLSFYNMESFLI